MIDLPKKNQIGKGDQVSIETKINQGTGKLTNGIVEEILTSSNSHPYGIKVRLMNGQIGRVKKTQSTQHEEIDKSKNKSKNVFVNLDEIKISKAEDRNNKFKEF